MCSKSRIKHNHVRHIFIAYAIKYLSCAMCMDQTRCNQCIDHSLMRYLYRSVNKTVTYDNKTKYIYKINTIFERFNSTLYLYSDLSQRRSRYSLDHNRMTLSERFGIANCFNYSHYSLTIHWCNSFIIHSLFRPWPVGAYQTSITLQATFTLIYY